MRKFSIRVDLHLLPTDHQPFWPAMRITRMPGVHSMRAQLSGLYVVALLCLLASMCLPAEAYMSNIADKFGMRQTCSGMWAGKNTSVQGTSGSARAAAY